MRRSPLPARRLMSGFQFKITHLPGVQRRARPQIAFSLAQQMPDQDGELAGGRDGGDVLTAAGAHALKEGAQRARHARRRPRRLHQHAAGMAASLLGDPSMIGWPWPRLPDAWIEAEIADKLLRTVEALGRADSRHERQRDDHVDAGNRHQTRDAFVSQRRAGKVALDRLEVFAKPVELAQMPLDRTALVVGRTCSLSHARPFGAHRS